MKKIMRNSFLMLVGLGMLAANVNAAGVTGNVVPLTNDHATSDPSIPADNSKAAMKSALADFNSLSRKEKKMRIKDVKKELKAYKKEKRNGNEPSTNTLLLVILAILLPPLAVYLHEGEINSKFWISLILTLLFFLPGIIYALIVVLGKD